MAAGAFSGNLSLLLLLLVSLFSSVHARPALDHFGKVTRNPVNTVTTVKTASTADEQNPSFYPNDVNPHGLDASSPPYEKPNAPPPPPPPPPQKLYPGLPRNFDPKGYTTNTKDQSLAFNPDVIEEDEEDTTAAVEDFDTTDFPEDEEEDKGTPPPPPPQQTQVYPGSYYHHKNKKMNNPQTKKWYGMSDTRFQENGLHHFSVEENRFTSSENPLNKINNQEMTYQKYNDRLTNPQSEEFEEEEEEEDELP